MYKVYRILKYEKPYKNLLIKLQMFIRLKMLIQRFCTLSVSGHNQFISFSDIDEGRSFEKVDDEEYFPSDGDNYEDDDDQDSSIDFDKESKFSNYSMTSSVIQRTQGYCQICLLRVRNSHSPSTKYFTVISQSQF